MWFSGSDRFQMKSSQKKNVFEHVSTMRFFSQKYGGKGFTPFVWASKLRMRCSETKGHFLFDLSQQSHSDAEQNKQTLHRRRGLAFSVNTTNPTSRTNIWKQAAKHCFSVLTIWSLIFMYCCLCMALFKQSVHSPSLSFISSQIYKLTSVSQFSHFVVTVVMTISHNAKCDQHAWGGDMRV